MTSPQQDCVAVVTRTRDRPLLLARAARSVAGQSFRDFRWIVVIDGGDEKASRDVISASSVPGEQVQVIHHTESRGMEAASNAGISARQSRFIAIHDDDDAWHPDFLAETVAYLEGRGRRYGGVVAGTTYVSEEIRDGSVAELGRARFHPWLETIELGEMMVQNLFPPIAFLYRRELWEQVGGYDESLPVLGDWDFNLRFLTRADIGVLATPLAYYHNRVTGNAGRYANTVVSQLSLHEEMTAVVRNKLARELGAPGQPSPLPALGHMVKDLRREIVLLRSAMSAAGISLPEPRRRALEALSDDGPGDDGARHAAVADAADRRYVLSRLGPLARAWISVRIRGVREEPTWADLKPWVRRARLQAPAEFDDEAYVLENADVRARIASGRYASGYDHYIQTGREEGRRRPVRYRRG